MPLVRYLQPWLMGEGADGPRIAVLSACNHERLQAVVRQMLQFAECGGDFSLADLAYTLQVGRKARESRLAMIVRDLDQLVRGLKHYLAHEREQRTVAEDGRPIPIFTGNLDEERLELDHLLAW